MRYRGFGEVTGANAEPGPAQQLSESDENISLRIRKDWRYYDSSQVRISMTLSPRWVVEVVVSRLLNCTSPPNCP